MGVEALTTLENFPENDDYWRIYTWRDSENFD